MAQTAFVSYLRVSTQQQDRSGLGLEAQRKAIADFLAGGSWRHVARSTGSTGSGGDAQCDGTLCVTADYMREGAHQVPAGGSLKTECVVER
jgi:hypothetical protein